MDTIDLLFVYLYGWCGAVVGILGLVGNLFSLMVLARKDFRTSNSNLYLIALCVYDTLFLALSSTVACLDWIVYGMDQYSLFNLEFTIPAGVVIDPILLMLICGSVYTTIALSIDRCIAVVKPLKWPSICTRRRVKLILFIVFVWSVLYNAPFIFEFQFEDKFLKSLNSTFLLSKGSDYSTSAFHTDIYLEYLVPIVTLVIPIVSIVIPNVTIVLVLRRQQTNMKDSRSTASQSSRTNRLTAQVLFISLFTLTSRVLHGVSYLLLDDVYYVTQCSMACACVTAVSAFMVNVNAAVNFVCYCLFGQKFRAAFIQSIFACLRIKRKTKNKPIPSLRFSSPTSVSTTCTSNIVSNQTTLTECETMK